MFTVFLVIQILLTLALVGLILIQRTDSDGLGGMGGGGGGNGFMTGRGAANLLTRSTAIIATLFMLNSLWLAIMGSHMHSKESIAESLEKDAVVPTVPVADEVEGQAPVSVTPAPTPPTNTAPEAAQPVEQAPAQGVAPTTETEQPAVPVP